MSGTIPGWVYQGRQRHGWFGDGTKPTDDDEKPIDQGSDKLFAPRNVDSRITYVAYRTPTQLVGQTWQWPLPDFDRLRLGQLQTSVAAWYGASGLSRNAFRKLLLDPTVTNATVDQLRGVAWDMVTARSYATLTMAGEELASAMMSIGLDHWPNFLADSEQRALAAVGGKEIPGVIKASAAGTDLGIGVIILGGLAVFGEMFREKIGQQPVKPNQPNPPTILPAKPPSDAKDPNGAKAPGKPGETEQFKDPKGGERWVKSPNGDEYGWEAADGSVWVPTGPGDIAHGGPHWDVQIKNGSYSKYPGGRTRK